MRKDRVEGKDPNLVAAAASASGIDELLDVLRPEAERYCLQFTHNRHDAEEVAQEAFLRVLATYPDVKEIERFRAVLFTVMSNLCISLSRRRVCREKYASKQETEFRSARPATDDDPARQALGKELSEAIENAFEVLPPNQRLALYLRSKQQLSYEDIAKAMGASIDDVKVWIHRGRKQMHRRLAPYLGSDKGVGTQE
jgi:RNA polymerase sigma-70 factor, ECF subfamily